MVSPSWLTPESYDILLGLAQELKQQTGKKIQVNDCCLIDGYDTPEHFTHTDGKDADIRNANMELNEEKIFLQLCIDNNSVQQVIYYTQYDLYDSNDKIKIDSSHDDHFHVDFV